MRKFRFIFVALAMMISVPIFARLARSPSAKAEFKRDNPCPSNGHRSGACPGWQVDHVAPLKCHGADDKSNMQWLTVEDHKNKTHNENGWCR